MDDIKEQDLRNLLSSIGIDESGDIYSSEVLSEKERIGLLAKTLADALQSKTNNSTKVNTASTPIKDSRFYLGFVSDAHSKLYQLEGYFKLLNAIGGKCVVTGDVTNGSNHANGHDSSLDETKNLTDDILANSDVLSRYKDMFIGYVEGNHDQWVTKDTSLLIGLMSCKIAKVDQIYAKNIQIVKQEVTGEDGKIVPFNFLLIHGEDMPADVVQGLKKALTKACGENVDAIIFGHTHKMGSANTTVVRKNSRGEWSEKLVGAYNPGTLLEASDYADKAGYPANTPFDGTVMRCSVVNNKKCIDIENIMNLVSEDQKDMLGNLKKQLGILEKAKFSSKEDLLNKYRNFKKYYINKKQSLINMVNNNGHYIVSINGTSDMFSPDVDESIRNKIRDNLKTLVSVVEKIPNVSVVLNGDLIYDYNKGYIEKKDYVSRIIADIQDLCDILKPISGKIVAINNGKMESSVMKTEKDKGNGRISKGKKLTELANYAVQSIQLDTKLAYEKYDPIEMHNRQVALQNDKVDSANQEILDKTYALFMLKYNNDPSVISELNGYYTEEGNAKDRDKKIKLALAEKLKANHEILDITNAEDRKKIDMLYPLSDIDLRMPNQNLIGNIFCKTMGLSPAKVKVSFELGKPTVFKFRDGEKQKLAFASYTTNLSKHLKELQVKLGAMGNPPDVVILNNAVTPSVPNQEEFTTPLKIPCLDNKGMKKDKDVMIINSGGFSYGRCMENSRIAPNIVYKIADVKSIFTTLIPKDSVNYPGKMIERQVIEKYNCESVLQKNSVTELLINTTIKQSLNKALQNFDQRNYISKNEDIISKFEDGCETEENDDADNDKNIAE